MWHGPEPTARQVFSQRVLREHTHRRQTARMDGLDGWPCYPLPESPDMMKRSGSAVIVTCVMQEVQDETTPRTHRAACRGRNCPPCIERRGGSTFHGCPNSDSVTIRGFPAGCVESRSQIGRNGPIDRGYRFRQGSHAASFMTSAILRSVMPVISGEDAIDKGNMVQTVMPARTL